MTWPLPSIKWRMHNRARPSRARCGCAPTPATRRRATGFDMEQEETLNPKLEALNKSQTQNPKRYDLGDRTLRFAKSVMDYIQALPRTMANMEHGRQLIRSSGSV